MKRYALLAVCHILFTALLFAKTEKVVVKQALNATSSMSLADPNLSAIISNTTNFTDKTVKNRLVLGIRYDVPMAINAPTTFEVSATLMGWDKTNVQTTVVVPLTIQFDPTGATWKTYQDQAVAILPDKYYRMTLQSFTLKVNNVTVAPFMHPFSSSVYLEFQHEVERFYNFTPTLFPVVSPIILVPLTNEIAVTWQAQTGAESYDVEWTYVDNFLKSITGLTYDFKNNATRISTTALTYRIPQLFEQGFVLFRVRSVGLGGINFTDEIFGDWSLPESGLVAPFLPNKGFEILPTAAHERAKNWQYTATFAEEGKSKHIITYVDGSSRPRQNVTKLSTDQKAIVAETFYDYQGSAAVQTLPVPTNNSILKYYPNFNLADSLGFTPKYSRYHFDKDMLTCPPTALPMSPIIGSEQYYSPNNPFLSDPKNNLLPRTEGYPFVHTEFMPDNTGRVRRQSGVGKNHRLGSGHETSYLYAQPFQEEIDQLFGTDVGLAAHYEKNAVVDANGQVSLSYLDLDRKVVATALTGGNPANLIALDELANASQQMTVDILNKQLPKYPQGIDNTIDFNAGTLSINREFIAVGSNNQHTFSYLMTPERFTDECLKTNCLDCVYDLTISLKDKCGNSLVSYQKQIGDTTKVNVATNSFICINTPFAENGLTASLNTGAYSLSKTLEVNKVALAHYEKIYMDSINGYNICLKKQTEFLTAALAEVDTFGCNLDCKSCLATIGTEADYIQKFKDRNNLTTLTQPVLDSVKMAYAVVANICQELCNEKNTCEIAYETMLEDVSPGGQYAQYFDETTGNFDPSVFQLSLMNNSNLLSPRGTFSAKWTQPRFWNSTTNNWVTGYFDEHGQPAKVWIGTNLVAPENLIAADFVAHFQPSWARSLVIFHPEYYFYEKCVKEAACNSLVTMPTTSIIKSLNSFQFDSLLQTIETRADALAFFGNTFDIAVKDPFFLSSACLPKPMNLGAFQTYFNTNYKTTGSVTYSAYQLAYLATHLFATVIPPTKLGQMSDDETWQRLKAFYFSEKQKLFYAHLRNYVATLSPAAINDCIGFTGYIANLNLGTNTNNQVCGWNNFYYYWQKTPRFPNPEHIGKYDLTDPNVVAQMEQDVDYCHFQQTGQCPMTFDLQMMLNHLAATINTAHQNLLTQANVNLETDGSLTPTFHDMLKNYHGFNWSPVFSNNNQKLTWTGSKCPFVLEIINSTKTFSDLVAIKKIKIISPTGNPLNYTGTIIFEAQGLILIHPDSIMPYDTVVLRGETCMPLVGCTFKPICNLTAEAKAMFQMMVWINQQGQFNATGFGFDVKNNPLSATDWTKLKILYPPATQYVWLKTANNIYHIEPRPFNVYHLKVEFKPTSPVNLNIFFELTSLTTTTNAIAGFSTGTSYIAQIKQNSVLTNVFCNFAVVKPVNQPPMPRLFPFPDCQFDSCQKQLDAPVFPQYDYHDPCVEQLLDLAAHNAAIQYNGYLDSLKKDFREKYITKCLSAVEDFTVSYKDLSYQYTLYYYDQAQNLVRTVPPKAVSKIPVAQLPNVRNARKNGTFLPAPHNIQLSTTYTFNSLNQTIRQLTPDGGETRYTYDYLGRLTLSQNAKQLAQNPNTYSYTNFDALGRIIEVGQIVDATILTKVNNPQLWNNARTEITTTIYDRSLFTNMKNLRGRIGTVKYQDAYNANPALYQHATHYSYDIHGNVPKLVQDIPILNAWNSHYKTLEYQFDLVSNKVNLFTYQRGASDQFIHQYSYDGDNRLTGVQTSPDGVIWAQDATYKYYLHAPVARTELGDLKVQGLDYVYTAQGWIKSVNGNTLTPQYDAGKDGVTNGILRDAFGYSLHYFHGDYKSIGTTNFIADATNTSFNNYLDLWNGNIAAMTTSITDGNRKQLPQGLQYQYDQLQRLKSQRISVRLDTVFNKWSNPSPPNNAYNMDLKYDQNGNITFLNRNGSSSSNTPIDKFQYNYKPNTNQLTSVDDGVSNPQLDPNDIESGQLANNYAYDEIGNLKQDLQEGITQIDWSLYGKVRNILRTGKPQLIFAYDAMGYRLAKAVVNNSSFLDIRSTYYVRDAQGNIISTYSLRHDSLFLSEQHLYGSSRLGVVADEIFLSKNGSIIIDRPPPRTLFNRKMGVKQYELTNHLGNVLTTVSDRRLFDGTTASFAEVKTSQDYYAFGMLMSGRGLNTEGYRFGFNGKENDNEVKGDGNYQDYGMRAYDGRLGRFFSVDPLTKDYPWYSPYQFAGNKPIWATDLDGAEENGTNADVKDTNKSSTMTSTTYSLKDNLKVQMVDKFKLEQIQLTLNYYKSLEALPDNDLKNAILGNGYKLPKYYSSKPSYISKTNKDRVHFDSYDNYKANEADKEDQRAQKALNDQFGNFWGGIFWSTRGGGQYGEDGSFWKFLELASSLNRVVKISDGEVIPYRLDSNRFTPNNTLMVRPAGELFKFDSKGRLQFNYETTGKIGFPKGVKQLKIGVGY